MRYELTDLRLFFAIAEAQNLSAGASSLYMSASSASYRLKNLEKAMGTSLFHRTPQGMTLTQAGESALGYVEQVLSTTEGMDSDISRYASDQSRNVRLLANSSSLNGFVVPSIGKYLAANSSINIHLEEMASQKIIPSVVTGDAEVGILASVSDVSNVNVLPYVTDELVIVTPLGHPLSGQDSVQLIDTMEYDFVSVERSSSNFLFLSSTVRQAGGRLNVRIHAMGFSSALGLVAEGVGIAMVPRTVAAKQIAKGSVSAVKLDEAWARRDLVIVTAAGATIPDHVQRLTDFLVTDVADRTESESGPSETVA
ncbi:LysR family transcriptional regulator [Paeniglutamicibacter sp. MACA_103]|uniref:LysR family transcriptional regulator n=1 Tax=Paeniglutamicibacter sp. MACA_103 TaxID=3377337 RepID=UPI003895C70F